MTASFFVRIKTADALGIYFNGDKILYPLARLIEKIIGEESQRASLLGNKESHTVKLILKSNFWIVFSFESQVKATLFVQKCQLIFCTFKTLEISLLKNEKIASF